jgi:hypothetical protein
VLESVLLGVLRWRLAFIHASGPVIVLAYLPGSNLPAGTQNIPSEGNSIRFNVCVLCRIDAGATLGPQRTVWLTASGAINTFVAQTSEQVAATSRTDRSLCFGQDGRMGPSAGMLRSPGMNVSQRADLVVTCTFRTVTSTCERVASTEPSSVVTPYAVCTRARLAAYGWLGPFWSPGTNEPLMDAGINNPIYA